ncbi:TPA: translation initiation factor IF-3 [Candidatus Uhrbacteria bacterium]|uniref:Translation initiation factor IF-3 n=1 Tax=Candidatus Uhrbacteria bacterium GW2011_GWC2_53_7 TaxID=1618986 RepID=A0A0G2A2R2_9BACT|nr:MAG: Translation initiation factor IF-3 [Parcubacteria group bacterium GW2011_GWA2_53_21]KKW35122.1 MAG: Translation initiation factor IF-3 [Candidatus Uhrbacteria bacterium GW2011_GWC2_53_7]HBL39785.1 translation initiation factor IF-3 [Candidatus Uhrbacteria bacterium]
MRIHRHRQNRPKIVIPAYKVNDRIDSEELFVIDENDKPLGVLKTADARRIAEERELDLVEVSPKANPPVAKLLEWKQFKYQKEKEVKKQRAQSKEVEVKGVRLSLRIAEGDKNVRLASAKKFMEKGNKVRIELILRGREKAHFELAREIIESFIENVRAFFPIKTEQPVKKMGNRVTAIITRE